MKNRTSLNVLVYGSTGAQASPIVKELVKQGHNPVLVTRSREKSIASEFANLKYAEADMLDKSRLVAITEGTDVVSLLIPFFLPDPQFGVLMAKNAVEAARIAKVKLIVWNSSGVIPHSNTGNPATDIRIRIKDILTMSGIPYIIFQPSIYSENLLGPWTAPFVKNKNLLAYPLPEEIGIGWVTSKDVASLIVASIEKPELAGRSFLVSGMEKLTGIELAACFSKGLGRKITYYAMPPKEFGALLDTEFGPGAGAKAANEYQKLWDKKEFQETYFDMKEVLEFLPVKMTTMEEWVKEHGSILSDHSMSSQLITDGIE
jgi:uncharacterized protein YbjT (DUF2867 family)